MYSAFLLAVLVVVRMRTASGGLVDDQACAKHVHEECKCDIAFEFGENENVNEQLCKKLQSCADCIAIPRCLSVYYLNQFRAMLRTTMAISKRTNICSDINFDGLYGGVEKACKGNGIVYDVCGRQCECRDGNYGNCYRVRKEFTQMSFEERGWYVNAYYKATTDRFLKDDFQRILDSHSEIPTDYLHHMSTIFFPWHRWFLLQAENFLRQIDCRVTIPYYQWTAPGKNVFRTTHPTDVWSAGPQGMGGDGVPPDDCVKDGKFREGNWYLPIRNGGGCLKRKFNKSCKFYNETQLNELLLSNSFEHFEYTVRETLHGKFHDCIGGNMPDDRVAGNAPAVLLHHSFIDKIWDQWQKRGNWLKYTFFPSINFRMPFVNLYPWQLLDNNILPGGVKVAYMKFKEPSRKSSRSISRKRVKQGDEEGDVRDYQENLTNEENLTDGQENDREFPDEQADENVEDYNK